MELCTHVAYFSSALIVSRKCSVMTKSDLLHADKSLASYVGLGGTWTLIGA